jgi:hypothetical protein
MDTNDKSLEMAEKVIEGLNFLHTHNLDVNNDNDIKITIEAVGIINATDKDVEQFKMLLQNSDVFLDKKARIKTKEEELPN